MNREQRRKSIKSKSNLIKVTEQEIVDKTLEQFQDKYKEAEMKGISYATNAILAVMCIQLPDKWGWGQVRLTRLLDQVQETFDAIDEKYVSVEDLKKILSDEIGIEIK